MAQHFPIIEWINEEWYPEMIKEIQRIVKTKDYSRVEVLPSDYVLNDPKLTPYIRDDHQALLYSPDKKFSMLIDNKTENWNPLRVNQCHFEIHINKENEIQEVYVPL